jgi:hypothetical protein
MLPETYDRPTPNKPLALISAQLVWGLQRHIRPLFGQEAAQNTSARMENTHTSSGQKGGSAIRIRKG